MSSLFDLDKAAAVDDELLADLPRLLGGQIAPGSVYHPWLQHRSPKTSSFCKQTAAAH